jgi:hypothetical protein
MFLSLTYLPLLANERTLDAFAREDGIFENLTAVYLFGISLSFAASLYFFRKAAWLLRLSYLGLALLFLLGAGEEISWGERIFDWDDHNYIRGINVQEEFNIHNLKYFQGEESILPVSVSQLFTAFAFVLAVIIPLASRFFPKIERFLATRFPVLPLPLGVLVVITYIFQKSMLRLLPLFPALYQHPSMPIPQGVHEIREHGYSFALLASAAFYFLSKKNASEVEERHAIPTKLAAASSAIPLDAKSAGDKT